jgi:hypothetical protein
MLEGGSPSMEIRIPNWTKLWGRLAQSKLGRILWVIGGIQFGWRVVLGLLGWKSQVEEAVVTAHQAAPFLGLVVAAVTSIWFGLALVFLGTAYFIFVPTTEHPKSAIGSNVAVWSAAIMSIAALFGVSVLIAALRLSQGSLPTSSPVGSGYMQLATIVIPQRWSTVATGKQLAFNVIWSNPVASRIFNTWTSVGVYVLDASPDADQKARSTFDTNSKKDREQYLAGKMPAGRTLGLNETYYVTVGTPPLTQQQSDGLLKGSVRIYLVSMYAWSDTNGPFAHKETQDDCRWLLFPDQASNAISRGLLNWHFC